MNVVELISSRKSVAAQSTRPDDAFRLALIIEGGGMRAVCAAGMAEELQALGLDTLFDSYHGSSAGGLIAAYVVAGQASVSADIFCNEAASTRFINLLRALILRPIMDMDWMIYTVFVKLRALKLDRIVQAKTKLHLVATSTLDGGPRELCAFSSAAHLLECLKATAFLPVIAGYSALIGSERFVDGGISDRLALRSAFSSSPTHLLILFTRPRRTKDAAKSLKDLFEEIVLRLLYGTGLSRIYGQRDILMDEILDKLSNDGTCEFRGIQIQAVFPPEDSKPPSRLAISKDRLINARSLGRLALRRIFGPAMAQGK